MDKKLIFVHGYTASSRADWYPAVKSELDGLGIDYSIPDLPGEKHPQSKDWVEIVKKEVGSTDKPVMLIGHSLGTRAVLLYLDQNEIEVDAVILIAPLSNETSNAQRRNGEAYPDFFEYKINVGSLKKKANKFIVMHSIDDSSLDYKQHGVALSEELGVKISTYEGLDHFCTPRSAPHILKVLKKIIT